MHPLEILDAVRRGCLSWVLPKNFWDRDADRIAPSKNEDWLLEPLNTQEAKSLYPHVDEERAVVLYQKLRLQLREQSGRAH